ncbi:DUF4384 domain-containing protein [Deinococcus maricopensis]|nr:DUF4384 domain-containing protein [Deinococcus maricopensis]
MKPGKLHISLLALAALSGASAAPQLSAQSIIVNPTPSTLKVNVRTNRAAYTPGDHLEFYTRVNQNAYVYLFNVDAAGQVTLLASNGLQAGGTFVKANTTRVFPRKGQPSTFLLTLPAGVNKVLALASTRKLNLRDLARFEATQEDVLRVNVQGQQGLAQALSIVVNPAPPSTWTTATAQYTITHRDLGRLPGVDAGALKSQVTFDARARLSEVFVAYANRLRADGYTTLTLRDSRRDSLSGLFVKGDRRVALDVKKAGRRFVVQLARRS